MKCIECPYYNEDGEWVCKLDECPFNDWEDEEWEDEK